MTLLPRDPFQKKLFAGFLVFLAISCLKPPYLDFMLMQHVPTIASLMNIAIASSVLGCLASVRLLAAVVAPENCHWEHSLVQSPIVKTSIQC